MSVSNCCRVFTAITAVAICWRWPSNKKSTFLYRRISTGPFFIICCHMCFNRYTMTDSGNISIWCEVRKTNGTVMFGLKKLLFMHCDLWLLFAKLQQTCEFIVSANNRQTRYSMGTLVIALPLTLIVMNLLRPVNSISLPVYASYNCRFYFPSQRRSLVPGISPAAADTPVAFVIGKGDHAPSSELDWLLGCPHFFSDAKMQWHSWSNHFSL